MSSDYTPSGLKIMGPFENDRNAASADLLKDIIREVYGVTDVIIAHHLTYVCVDHRDGFDYQVVEEIPAVDTLVFDHDVAKCLWGQDWEAVLSELACLPCSERDQRLHDLYYGRKLDGRQKKAA